jgi:serine/threonine-protein kinase
MLTGKRAFEGVDVSDTLATILKQEPDWLALPPTASPSVRRLLARCVRKDPKQRLRDIGDARVELTDWVTNPDSSTVVATRPGAWRRGARSVVTMAIVGALTLGLLAGTFVAARISSVQPTVQRFAVANLPGVGPGSGGVGRHVTAISPQGTHVVYWANNQLFLRAMDQLEAFPIQGTEGAREPFFSPDGQWIGFFQLTQAKGQLRKASIGGGPTVLICEADNPWGANWSDDDVILFGQGPGGIWQVPGSGGTAEQIISVPEGSSAHGPQRLGIEDWILFTLATAPAGWDEAQIVVESRARRERRVVVKGARDGRYLRTGHLVYGANRALYAAAFDLSDLVVHGSPVLLQEGLMDADVRTGAVHFSVSATGSLIYLSGGSGERRTLAWMSRDGRPEPLPVDPLPYSRPRISPDGTQIAVDVGKPGSVEVHLYDVARGGLTRLGSDPARGRFPLWTRDSRRVVVYSDFDGGGLFLKPVDGTGKIQRLTRSPAIQVPNSWSLDGRSVVFEQGDSDPDRAMVDFSRAPSNLDVYTSRIDGGEPTPLLNTSVAERGPMVSPDGHWVAYTANEAGRNDVYVRPFPNVEESRKRVSSNSGFQPVWSRDGKELFFIGGTTGAPQRLFSQPTMMVASVQTTPAFQPGIAKEMFKLPPFYQSALGLWTRHWDIAPDGKRFLVVLPEERVNSSSTGSTMVIVTNWFEELKRLVPTQ